ncbi:hypothetical protein PBC1_019 [Bacillus phage PBC1]|uniref:Tail protein n=1 Tax=Bacillus phage PBC1 TaxID=1161901 RepID=I1TLF3_9CAUD|nr:hypothetical protein PBC1_gp19 [Bacillus phage PBC1]AFE86255.1 hypothetical protein PBC1_019 [Bacillus phage PBC1]
MIKLARDGYTDDEIKAVLHGKQGARSVSFRYELLDKDNNFKMDLYNVTDASIDYGIFNEINRTAKFNIMENKLVQINYLSDRIRPYMILDMPAMKKAGVNKPKSKIEFPLGIFLLSSPDRVDADDGIVRSVEAYDLSKILHDDCVDDIYTVPKGTNYKQAIIAVLQSAGIKDYNIEDTTKATTRDIEFEVGTPKIKIVNQLCNNVNFTSITVDIYGTFRTFTYMLPEERAIDYTYEDNDLSVIMRGMQEQLDTFAVPNKWIVVRTNAEEAPLRSVYTNDNPASPTSTINRGRTIVDYRELEDIADQEALDAHTKRLASNASQIYGKIKFNTALMPMHDYHDIIHLKYSKLGIDDKFSEIGWTMDLSAGGVMNHDVRRVVYI